MLNIEAAGGGSKGSDIRRLNNDCGLYYEGCTGDLERFVANHSLLVELANHTCVDKENDHRYSCE